MKLFFCRSINGSKYVNDSRNNSQGIARVIDRLFQIKIEKKYIIKL